MLPNQQLQTKNRAYLSSKEGKALLNRFVLPVANRYVERLVRKTLRLSDEVRLENSHLKEAAASTLLYPLRQVVGSCFATAPAIYIQSEKPERLLLDLYDLMMKGKMKRTFGGEEYVVPISPKWGKRGDDHPLLRVWEYTIASFADYRTSFSRWNLYSSLGLDPKYKDGLGGFIYSALQEKLDALNQEVEKLQNDYARAVDEVRVSESLLRQADSTDRMRVRKGEHDGRAHHAKVCREMRDKAHEKAQGLAQFFPFLIEQYSAKFQEHFLEVFDAEVQRMDETLYEDSPAGFRLVYKHGRSDPAAWTFIQNKEAFFDSLRHFFIAVEPQISTECEWKGGKKEIEALTTQIVHFIETKPFQTFALQRKKPWSYTSGGSLHTFLKGYFMIEGEVMEEKRAVENPTDLLTFLLDLLKSLPYTVTKPFETDPSASLLMYSPTHAFLLKPGLSPFKEGWLDNGFTYTWIRDTIIDPARKRYASIRVDREAQSALASKIVKQGFYPHPSPLSLPDLRDYLLKGLPGLEDEIDNLLFQTFHSHSPLLFGDTNWLDYAFGFAVNPATLELDLYRVSADGKRVYPMNPWRCYLDGSKKEDWGVLTRPSDYAGSRLSDLGFQLKRV